MVVKHKFDMLCNRAGNMLNNNEFSCLFEEESGLRHLILSQYWKKLTVISRDSCLFQQFLGREREVFYLCCKNLVFNMTHHDNALQAISFNQGIGGF